MPRTAKGTPPSYRRHKSGQARVTLPLANGKRKDVLLGPYGSPESYQEYERALAEWRANNGRFVPDKAGKAPDLTVNELLVQFLDHADQHYRHADGTPTDEIHCIRAAVRPLRALYGHTLAREFGPLALGAVRERMIGLGWCRKSINLHVSRIKSIFKWAGAKELIPPTVHHGLLTLTGLQRGRSAAKETKPVQPVPDAYVEAALPYMLPQVRAMMQLQRLTGMRSGEVVIMRTRDLDVSGAVWIYRPVDHKNSWRGHDCVVAIGPRAQEILKPWLRLNLEEYLFQPAEAAEAQNAERHQNRKTKPQRGREEPAKLRVAKPRRKPGSRYTTDSYRHAVTRACDKADASAREKAAKESGEPVPADRVFVHRWHPHQLRHSAATEARRQFGLEAGQAGLGDRDMDVVQIYAQADLEKAKKVALAID